MDCATESMCNAWYSFIFTFFYINRRKYWFRANFRFSVFDGFTRFGMSWTRFDYFWRMCVCLSVCVSLCVCDKNFVTSVARDRINRILLNFLVRVIIIYQFLMKIGQLMLLWLRISPEFFDKYITVSFGWNYTKIHVQNIY